MEGEVVGQPVVEKKLEADSKIFAALSYISLLFIIPWIIKKEDRFVMYHVKQGVALFLAEAIVWIILWFLETLLITIFSFGALTLITVLYKLAWLFFAALSIIGIYYAIKGKKKPLPWLWIITKNLKI